MERWFAGKSVLVTGGGDGIGRAAALLFAARGARVVVSDINTETGAATVEDIKTQGGEAFCVIGDVSDEVVVRSCVEQAVAQYGRLDCAFNNAGVTDERDSAWDVDAFRRTIGINLNAVMYGIKHEVAAMLKTGGGTIVNTSSISGLVASAALALPAYTSSKHAVIGLTKTAALQHARSGIRVNAICPGVTHTAIVRRVIDYAPDAEETMNSQSPIGRMARPEEVAEAAIWLASDKSSFVNGHSLVVDGGATVQ